MMTFQRSRLVSLAAPALASLLLLAGCGGKEQIPEAAGGEGGAGAAQEEVSPNLAPDPAKIVATVNGAPIKAEQVYEVASINMAQSQARGTTFTEEQEQLHRLLALDLIIDNELLSQEADRVGTELSPDAVDKEIQTLKEQRGTEAEFEAFLAKAGVTEESLREEMAKRLRMQAYIKQLTAGVKVTDQEARAAYDADPDRFKEGEQVRASQILVRSSASDPEPLRERKRKRIDEAYKKAAAGEDFAALAREYSEAPNADKGGDLGLFPRGVMVPAFEKVAFTTPVGEISEVFETSYGYNIVKVTGKQEATPIPFEEIRPKLKLELVAAKESRRVQAKLAELRKAAKVEILDPEFLPAEEKETAEQPGGAG